MKSDAIENAQQTAAPRHKCVIKLIIWSKTVVFEYSRLLISLELVSAISGVPEDLGAIIVVISKLVVSEYYIFFLISILIP